MTHNRCRVTQPMEVISKELERMWLRCYTASVWPTIQSPTEPCGDDTSSSIHFCCDGLSAARVTLSDRHELARTAWLPSPYHPLRQRKSTKRNKTWHFVSPSWLASAYSPLEKCWLASAHSPTEKCWLANAGECSDVDTHPPANRWTTVSLWLIMYHIREPSTGNQHKRD